MSGYRASRLISAASLGYGVFCAVRPRHLGQALEADASHLETYDKVAYGYAVRDIPVSLTGMLGPASAVETAIKVRIAADLFDAASLALAAPNGRVRAKVLAVTLSWAALNTAALAWDRRHA